jgi:hypothetical protein
MFDVQSEKGTGSLCTKRATAGVFVTVTAFVTAGRDVKHVQKLT